MKAEIIAIGNELLSGAVQDTNSTFVSKILTDRGVEVAWRSTAGDAFAAIAEALRLAATRADVVICTGGLGPTVDDVTIDAAAETFGLGLETQPEVESKIRDFYKMLGVPCGDNALRQARTLVGSQVLANYVGTAPGVFVKHGKSMFLFFPGVPRELHKMLEPALDKALGETGMKYVSRSLKVSGIGESQLETLIPVDITTCDNPKFSFLPQYFEVELRLTARGSDTDECNSILDAQCARVYNAAGQYIYGEGDTSLELEAFRHLERTGRTVAFAESFTGGLIAKRFTAIPGISRVFAGGVVAYQPDVKCSLLGVPEATIATHGVISAEVALAMASGAIRLTGADMAVATTGNAGPDINDSRSENGRVFIALVHREISREPLIATRVISRNRDAVRHISASMAFDIIRKS